MAARASRRTRTYFSWPSLLLATYNCATLMLWYWTCRVSTPYYLLVLTIASCGVAVFLASALTDKTEPSEGREGGWDWNSASTRGVLAAAANWAAAWPAAGTPVTTDALVSVRCLGGLGILSGVVGVSVFLKAHLRPYDVDYRHKSDGEVLKLEHAECAALFQPTLTAFVTLFAVGVVALLLGYNSPRLPLADRDLYFYACLAVGMVVWLLRPFYQRMRDIRLRLRKNGANPPEDSRAGPPQVDPSEIECHPKRAAPEDPKRPPSESVVAGGGDIQPANQRVFNEALAEYTETNEMLRKTIDILYRCGVAYITVSGFGIALMSSAALAAGGKVGVLLFLIVVDLLSFGMTWTGYRICCNLLGRLTELTAYMRADTATITRNRVQLRWSFVIGSVFVAVVLAATVVIYIVVGGVPAGPTGRVTGQSLLLPF